MSYLPVGLSLINKNILLVGGGEIAFSKFEKLVQFNPSNLKIVAKSFNSNFTKIENLNLVTKEFSFDDLEGIDIVIVAIDDPILQRQIYHYCQSSKILCNCVDLTDCCDFIFTAFIKNDDVVISINTNGKAPGLSAALREYFENKIPKNLNSIFEELVSLRKSLPPGKSRMEIVRKKAKELLEVGSR